MYVDMHVCMCMYVVQYADTYKVICTCLVYFCLFSSHYVSVH